MSQAVFQIPPTLRSWAEIDLSALRHNLAAIRKSIGDGPKILAVVKANAYGHGTEEVARAIAHDVELFGVASIGEAQAVAAAGTGKDIVILSPCLPAEYELTDGFIVTVSSAEEGLALSANRPTRLNFKIDTGMGRVGVWHESAIDQLRELVAHPDVHLHSISTHLPSSDEDFAFTQAQLASFGKLVEAAKEIAPGAQIHSLNSAGILKYPESAHDIVRAGLVLYGISPLPEMQHLFRPVLTWKTRVTLVRDLPAGTGVSYGRTFVTSRATRIALLAVGYADGFPRQISGKMSPVLIDGKPFPVIGRVTMDQIVIDVTDGGERIRIGDEAVLIGNQGGHSIMAGDLARSALTIPWEIFTGIKGRVTRIYAQ